MLDPYCELSTAISEYTTKKLKELEAKREQERIEREEREAMRAEQEAYGGGSSGSDILKTAAGVALGNKISNRGRKGNGKRDLMGTTVCQYGKRNKAGFKQTCAFCPVSDKCSRY